MADGPLRRRLRDLGGRNARGHPGAARRRRPGTGSARAAAVTSQDPGGPHERRVQLPRLPHPVETQERLGQVVRLHLYRRPAATVGEGQDPCPDTQDIAAGSRVRADQARSDHARMGELLQARRGQADLQQARCLHLVEARAHAADPQQMELGTSPPPPQGPQWAVGNRGGRGRVLPDQKRDGYPLRLPGEQDPEPMATCEPRLTAAAAESPLPGDRHGGFGERPGLCPEFRRTEGSSAGTEGCSRSMGRSGPWVRGNRQRRARRRSPGAGVRWPRT